MQNREFLNKTSITVALAFLIQISINLVGISNNPATPFDEAAHFDYVVKLSQGHLPKVNEKLGQTTLNWIACDPNQGEAWKNLDPCGSEHYDPKKTPFGGQSSATPYVPTYYLLTSIPFEICNRVTNLPLINCGRISNSLWLASASALGTYLLIGFGLGTIVSIAISVGLSTLPAVLLQGITVNSDAVAQFGGVFLVWLVLALLKSRKPQRQKYFNLLIGIIFILTLKQTLLPLAVVLIAVFLAANFEKNHSLLRTIIKFVAMSSCVALGSMLLSLTQPALRGVGGKDYMADWLTASIKDMSSNLQVATNSALTPFSLLTWGPTATQLLGTLSFLTAILLWMFIASREDQFQWRNFEIDLKSPWLRTLSFAGLIVGPLVLVIIAFVITNTYPVQPRYYMASLSALGLLSIGANKNRSMVNLFATLMGCVIVLVVRALV